MEWEDSLEGGLADKNKPSDFDQDALMDGIHVELEHTKDIKTAMEIAMDHLIEDPKYYTKLDKMESENISRKIPSMSEVFSTNEAWPQDDMDLEPDTKGTKPRMDPALARKAKRNI